jgi:aldose sugar dehydrogenase
MHLHQLKVVSVFLCVVLFPSSICIWRDTYAQPTSVVPSVNDNNLQVEPVITGLDGPVSIAFLGPQDILLAERSTGIVHRIIDGQLIKEPLLDVNVFNFQESGMLGIGTAKNHNGKVYVFIYYTKAEGGDSSGQEKNMGNRLYRYELINNKLVNPKLLLALPRGSGWHNGGAIRLGPDGNLYIPVGDLSPGVGPFGDRTQAQNNQDGLRPNLSGGILRMTQDGRPVGGIIGDSFPESLYFAYGIRNSFGIDFDPITGNMWDTENGPSFGDEINIVKPGFNSGWSQVQGTWKRDFADRWEMGHFNKPDNLVDFDGKGKYSSPEFIWEDTVGPTAIKFLTTPKLGSQYENDIFVGDIKYGRLYHFDLNKNRTGLQLNGELSDKVANKSKELSPVIFGKGFNGISDLEIGPDGYLYVVSLGFVCNPEIGHVVREGTIYKISPKTAGSNISNKISIVENTDYNNKIVGKIASNTTLNNMSVPIEGDNGRILLMENETHWSAPLQLNATYIEGSFRMAPDKNEKGKDYHAGLVWQEGNNKTYYAFVRPGEIALSDSIGEISCSILVGANKDNWNKIMIINSAENIHVYYNDTLRMKVPREFDGTDISLVGIRSNNTKAEFDPLKVGQFPQNLSRLLLPDAALTVNENNSISIKTREGSFQ